jgi:hypothetical protein
VNPNALETGNVKKYRHSLLKLWRVSDGYPVPAYRYCCIRSNLPKRHVLSGDLSDRVLKRETDSSDLAFDRQFSNGSLGRRRLALE